MFNLNPENLCGDTNKLLSDILSELRQLNESLRPIAKDTVIQPVVAKPKVVKPKKGVTKNVNTRPTRKLPKVQ